MVSDEQASPRSTRRRAATLAAVLGLTLAFTACSSTGSRVYVDDVVEPTTSRPLVVPATTTAP